MEIQSSENLGALARLCGNFQAEKLIAVRPQCRIKDKKTYYTATDARSYIDGIVRLSELKDVYKHVDYLLALTGRPAKDSLERNVVSIHRAAEELGQSSAHIGIVLGPENAGLSNKELAVCDLAATIPLLPESRTFRVLNISHAAALALYELSRNTLLGIEIPSGHRPIDANERELLRSYINRIADKAFVPPHTKENAALVLDSVLGRASVNKKEIGLILTLLRGIQTKLEKE